MKKKEAENVEAENVEAENVESETKRYSMFLTGEFSKRLDKLKAEKGFKHRSNVIIYLLNIALDLLENQKKMKGNENNEN